MNGGRLPDPGLGAICARCNEPREAHGGPKHYGACPDQSGLRADRFRLQETDKPPPEDSWEHRMAARAAVRRAEREALAERERAAAAEAIRAAVDDLVGRDGWEWLNGWPRMGETGVLMGTAVHCLGCGDFHGITCVVFPDDWEPPGPDPVWPYTHGDCPICRDPSGEAGERSDQSKSSPEGHNAP